MIGAWDYPFADDARHPGSPITRDGKILLTGWALLESDARIRILVDGEIHEELRPDFRREDIDIIFHTQKAKDSPSGWLCVLDAAAYPAGSHEIEVVLVDHNRRVELGRRHIVFGNLAEHSPMDAFLATSLLTAASGYKSAGHRHYFGTEPGVWRTSPSSAMGFSGQARTIIQTCEFVLVVGAGVNNTVPNVCQLDIFDYPNVDVATDGGVLPFADGSFDGLICENVIEHVPDPKQLVQEIHRVLKPGGRISINGTNLHFTHGFPYHYFNPTEWGMRLLLEQQTKFKGSYHNQDVVSSLRMVLNYVENALSPEGRRILGGFTFAEIMASLRGRGPTDVIAALQSIAPDAEKAISTNVHFIGEKSR